MPHKLHVACLRQPAVVRGEKERVLGIHKVGHRLMPGVGAQASEGGQRSRASSAQLVSAPEAQALRARGVGSVVTLKLGDGRRLVHYVPAKAL